MLNTVVKRLFAFNCAIYSLPYIFYPKFTQRLPNILPSFSFDLLIRKRNLKSWFKYPWKDCDKEKLKRGPGKEQWTVLLTKNKNRNANMISQYTNIIFFSFQEHFHVLTFALDYILSPQGRLKSMSHGRVLSKASPDCPGPTLSHYSIVSFLHTDVMFKRGTEVITAVSRNLIIG